MASTMSSSAGAGRRPQCPRRRSVISGGNHLRRSSKGEGWRGGNGASLGYVVSRAGTGRYYGCGVPTTSSNFFVPQNRDKRAKSPSLSCVNVRVRAKNQQGNANGRKNGQY